MPPISARDTTGLKLTSNRETKGTNLIKRAKEGGWDSKGWQIQIYSEKEWWIQSQW